MRTGLFLSISVLLMLFPSPSLSSGFDEAQRAAAAGDYGRVVAVLSELIDGGLAGDDRVIAYANRGVAYSLLKSYGEAKSDLLVSIELDPSHLLSQNHLGILAEHVDSDYSEAVTWYRLAAEDGYAPSQTNLATLYRKGRGVRVDLTRAFSLYRAAAIQGYSMAFVPLGEMYLDGIGVEQDYALALEWIRKALDAGIIAANYHLGRIYERGLGLPQDPGEAYIAYLQAALQGHGPSQNALGYLYRRGLGVRQDFVKAAEWYQLAADQGETQATNRLAWLMATCPQSDVCDGGKALALATQAVAAERSATNLDSLAAAHARLGDFESAIALIDEILTLDSPNAARYRSRLKLYREEIAYQM